MGCRPPEPPASDKPIWPKSTRDYHVRKRGNSRAPYVRRHAQPARCRCWIIGASRKQPKRQLSSRAGRCRSNCGRCLRVRPLDSHTYRSLCISLPSCQGFGMMGREKKRYFSLPGRTLPSAAIHNLSIWQSCEYCRLLLADSRVEKSRRTRSLPKCRDAKPFTIVTYDDTQLGAWCGTTFADWCPDQGMLAWVA